MMKIKATTLLLITAFMFLGGISTVHGAGGADWWGPFGTPYRGGDTWTGVLSITLQVVDVSSQPDRLGPSSEGPIPITSGYKDAVVMVTFTGNLQTRSGSTTLTKTFSGIAKYEEGGKVFNHFWLIGDSLRIIRSIRSVLEDEIFPAVLPDAVLVDAGDPSPNTSSNVRLQTQVGLGGFSPEEPLYSSVSIVVSTP